ncbi:MAG: type II secretion system F family protein [Alphaproteobacteria bacterium]|nr:type II secretion system F family protein [Alphaproteobacteria bacterium]
MPCYAYRAVHPSGRIAHGSITAVNENELDFTLSQAGLELIDAREKKPAATFFPARAPKLPPRVLAAFCSRLHDLLAAHLSLPDALSAIQTATSDRTLTQALAQIVPAIAAGKSVGDAFALYPSLFPPLFIALVRAGEQAGQLTASFLFLAQYAERRAQSRERIGRALRYPLFLFLIAGSAVGFMASTVIPQMTLFLESLHGTLPFSTRLLMAVSEALRTGALPVLFFLILTGIGFVLAQKYSPSLGPGIDRFLLRLPVLGTIILKTELARAAHSLAILFQSGCSIAQSVRQAGDALSNRALKNDFALAEQKLVDGASLSVALEGIFPPFAIGLLRTGEKSGNLLKSLEDIVSLYEREATAALDSFIGVLEPALTVLIGGVLAWTVLAVLGPLYGSLSLLGGGV